MYACIFSGVPHSAGTFWKYTPPGVVSWSANADNANKPKIILINIFFHTYPLTI